MSESSQDRVHPATATRIEQARRDGNIGKSQELAIAMQLLMALLAIYLLANAFVSQLSQLTTETWSTAVDAQYGVDQFQKQISQVAFRVAGLLLPLLGVILIVSVMSHLIQTGPMLVGDRVAPDVSRLSPVHWFKRVFSISSVVRGALGIPKALIVIGVAVAFFWTQREAVLNMSGLPVRQMVVQLKSIVLGAIGCVAASILVTSLLDYALERYDNWQRLRMSEQEFRDEQRMQSVDPQITTKRRSIHQDLTT